MLLDEGVNMLLNLVFSGGKSVVSCPFLNGFGKGGGVLDLRGVVG